ncbi:DUF7342 family protein [Halopiger goleimassiliensis]|uniref:DUF7342 family protein n=1 Tax=Halopiger goleimassiliensis TaxID=1293048 RepID=UPI00067814F7|nr:transcriptional regulator [Halopiger goleimassiliensis]
MSEDPPGVNAWTEETSAFDRVRAVAGTLSEPTSAQEIAVEAHVAENTAREHLDRLVEMGILLESTEGRSTVYSPDPLHTRMQTLRDLLEEHDHDELIELKADMQDRIEQWQDEYGVDGPADLREVAATTENATETRDIMKTASDWELLEYRLDVVEDAIERYSTYSRDYRANA